MKRQGWLRAAILAALAAAPAAAAAADPATTPAVRVEAGYTWDNNVNRATAADAAKDTVLSVRASVSGAFATSTHTRTVVQGFVGTERFHTYNGLSRNFIGGQADVQYRAAGDFGRATYGAFYRIQGEDYESTLRDGNRQAYGVTVIKPWTDRVTLVGSLSRNITDGSSTVFDTKNTSLRGNVDWSLNNWNVVYASADFRKGDSVSSVCHDCDPIRTLGLVATAAPNIVPDDAFSGKDAYKIKASTFVATLGYNLAFTGGQSLDLSWRRILSKGENPQDPATQSDINYYATQFSLAYLVRF